MSTLVEKTPSETGYLSVLEVRTIDLSFGESSELAESLELDELFTTDLSFGESFDLASLS